MYSSLSFFTVLFMVFSTFSDASIQCYSCDSINTDYCDDPFNDTLMAPIYCENDNFACLKQEKFSKELNVTYLHRRCVQKHFCEVLAKASDFCYTCTYDFCNSSCYNFISYYLLFLFFAIASIE